MIFSLRSNLHETKPTFWLQIQLPSQDYDSFYVFGLVPVVLVVVLRN